MTAYRLQAKHSITRDRARGTRHSSAVIQLRCTLTVYLLVLQPLVDVILRNPLSKRRPRAISITNIIRSRDSMDYGAMTWTFTLNLHTSNERVRTHRWWGRQLPMKEIEELPLALLTRLETEINQAWYYTTKSQAATKTGAAVLMMLD